MYFCSEATAVVQYKFYFKFDFKPQNGCEIHTVSNIGFTSGYFITSIGSRVVRSAEVTNYL